MEQLAALLLALTQRLISAPQQNADGHELIFLSLAIAAICNLMTLWSLFRLRQISVKTESGLAELKKSVEECKAGRQTVQNCQDLARSVAKMCVLWSLQFRRKWDRYLFDTKISPEHEPTELLEETAKRTRK